MRGTGLEEKVFAKQGQGHVKPDLRSCAQLPVNVGEQAFQLPNVQVGSFFDALLGAFWGHRGWPILFICHVWWLPNT